MPEKIDNNMLSPCGINCIACYKHLAAKKACEGCLVSENNKPKHCLKCRLKECVNTKGITYCFECGEFPCKQIKSLEKRYFTKYQVSVIKNSTSVRDLGFVCLWKKKRRSGLARNVEVLYPNIMQSVASVTSSLRQHD